MPASPSQSLLAVFAHPDDESFGVGGTLALYARRGAAVHLICATRGEAGTVDEHLLEGFKDIADLRESELRCAAGILGLTSVHFLGWRDSGMAGSADNQHPQALINQPLEQVAAQIAEHIRRLQPQVVVTFDPIGGYRHPDHIHVHQATVRAFHLAADPAFPSSLPPHQPQRLYYSTIPKGYFKWIVRLLPLFGLDPRRFGRNKDINLLEIVNSGDFPVHARIDYRPVLAAREDAAACHSSQTGSGLSRGPLRWVRSLVGTYDLFMRAYPPAPPGLHENDLFSDIE